MEYQTRKPIKGDLDNNKIISSIKEVFRNQNVISEKDGSITFEGFRDHMGGINYKIEALFEIIEKDNKKIIDVFVSHKTSAVFWILFTVLIVLGVVFVFIPVFFYFHGKKQVLEIIDKGLQEVKEEVE